ncbi:MAG TPA: flagellar hook-length control protein FliK, partial [Planctomycetota bacterium]|nr:flagellar hook-length control protein FliK [Planctomycetota bacterium]
ILQQVRLRLLPGAREATLQLEPARLGRLSIRLELRRGVTRAEVVAEEAATLAVLERHEPELRAALTEAGFEGVEVELRHAGEGERDATFGERRAPTARDKRRPPPPHELTRALTARLTDSHGVDTYA